MKQFLAALHIASETATLEEITRAAGVEPAADSFGKGDRRGLRETPCPETVWTFYSPAPEMAGIEEHLAALLAGFPMDRLRGPGLPADRTITLDIAVLYDTFTASVALPAELLRPFVQAGAGIEISCYPTSFEEAE
ncbi:MAG TPA: hypothetical protein VGM37_08655 [Armatimonadota bacterium]|jgi:hypothetical protein